MKKESEKKGAISVDFLIGMILLVLGFVIVLIFYFNIGGTGTLDKDICHESVILRASLPTLVENYVPLKCKTAKICITSGLIGDILKTKECRDLAGEKNIQYKKVRSVTDIEKVYAEEILSCWQMMGEGKASIFNQYIAKTFGAGWVYPTCSICSRIAFDNDTITADKFDFSRMDVSRYMMTHLISGKNVTYFEYMASENGKAAIKENLITSVPNLTTSTTNPDKIPDVVPAGGAGKQLTPEDITSQKLQSEAKNLPLQLKESAVLFMQISAPQHGESLKNSVLFLAGISAGSFILAPSLTGRAFAATGEACASNALICGIAAIAGVAIQQTMVAYNRAVTAGYCGDVSVGTEARSGCSAVRTVDYNLNDISSYCKVIESIP